MRTGVQHLGRWAALSGAAELATRSPEAQLLGCRSVHVILNESLILPPKSAGRPSPDLIWPCTAFACKAMQRCPNSSVRAGIGSPHDMTSLRDIGSLNPSSFELFTANELNHQTLHLYSQCDGSIVCKNRWISLAAPHRSCFAPPSCFKTQSLTPTSTTPENNQIIQKDWKSSYITIQLEKF